MKYAYLSLFTVAILQVSCASMDNAEIGTIVGATAGAAVGAAVADDNEALGAAVGAVIGGLAGRQIGIYMDKRDHARTAAALEENRIGERAEWVNPDSGLNFAVTPTRTFTNSSGQPCREFDLEKFAGRDPAPERVSATACRSSQGVWHSS